jgi:ATP-dependent DNA helicase RecG
MASSGRPFVLDPLFRAVTVLPGVGPRSLKLYERLMGGGRVADLLFHKPVDLVERSFADSIAAAPEGKIVCLTVTVDKHTPAPRRSQPYRIRCRDQSGFIDLSFFNIHGDWIEKQYPVGRQVIIGGKVEDYRGQRQMVHPDYLGTPDHPEKIETRDVIYPMTAGLMPRVLRKAVLAALDMAPALPEWLDPAWQKKTGAPGWKESLTKLHNPESAKDLEPSAPARLRLAYDELLANQLTLSLVRAKQKKMNGRAFQVRGPLYQKLLSSLPWKLTRAQQECLDDINSDMGSKSRMLRLLARRCRQR